MDDKSLNTAKQCNVLADILVKNKGGFDKNNVDELVKEVLSLNPESTEIGDGKMARLIQLAKEVESGR